MSKRRSSKRRERVEARLAAAQLAQDEVEVFKALLTLGRVRVRQSRHDISPTPVRLCLVPSCDACTAAISAGWVKLPGNPSAVARERYCVTHASQACFRAVRVPKHLR